MVTAKSNASPVVVVGVDGSLHSLDALRWAAGYALAFGALLRPLVAWSYSSSPEYVTQPDFESSARDSLEAALKLLHTEFHDVAVEPGLVQGSAASVLIDASRDADLLVVGTRGRGGFAGMLLGSVSQHCVQHATCPVVVVRDGVQSARGVPAS